MTEQVQQMADQNLSDLTFVRTKQNNYNLHCTLSSIVRRVVIFRAFFSVTNHKLREVRAFCVAINVVVVLKN